MKNYKIDLHIHTNVNPHAFSTLEENISAAAEKGMEIIAITNHGPALPDSPKVAWYLDNIFIIPEYVKGVRIIKGVEANILDTEASLDVNEKTIYNAEIVLAGLHEVEVYGYNGDIEKNTLAVVNLMKSQKADVIVHLGNPRYPIDYEKVIKAAKENDVALEINNSSLGSHSRVGSAPNCKKMLELAKKEGCYISLGTDSHFSEQIGNFQRAIALLEEVDYPNDLVINSSQEQFYKFLELRKKLRTKN